MKARALILCLLSFFTIPLFAQTTDRDLVEKALEESQSAPKKTHKVYHLFRDQLRGGCYYEPECVEFYPRAVRQLGFLRGTLSMIDRMMRDTYIGTATFPAELKGEDGKIHEGPDAYRRRRTPRK